MNKFNAILLAYGADIEGIMQRFMGQESIYLRIFAMLFRDENLNNLKKSLKSSDFDGAFHAAHTLKGVSSNLGLTPYYNAITTIVESLRFKNKEFDYNNQMILIEQEYDKVCTLYKQLSTTQ